MAADDRGVEGSEPRRLRAARVEAVAAREIAERSGELEPERAQLAERHPGRVVGPGGVGGERGRPQAAPPSRARSAEARHRHRPRLYRSQPAGVLLGLPATAAVASQMRAVLERAIGELPEDYRVVLVLRDVEGMTNEEVARALGLTVAAVKSRLHRARLLVRHQVGSVAALAG
ncbi:MAG: sigma-70 family RNA polymerase sigma factor [Candidatus Rokubacteria bacterium]|nr:sigma-70 family RNA polymerase sigma factor [Candidatus Rokubacteria bacterium]